MKENSIIYQIFLRTATKDGDIKSAERLLGHIADLGADIVYLCPVFEMDDDNRKEFWSYRQRKSGIENPKNPYRIKDYFKIDSEYGTDEDLKSFVKTAHRLGLRVMFDLVYFHCAPNAVLIGKGTDFIKRLPDGAPDTGEWNFPKLNFDCAELCEYLWSNMEYLVKNFDIDGYRCDVGDEVPLEFWREGRKRVEKIKSDFIMINEGTKEDWVKSGVFDANYGIWGIEAALDRPDDIIGDASMLGKRVICFENHDSASDGYENRFDKKYGKEQCDAMLVFVFTSGGIPFIYNGNEIADCCRHSLWGNRFYGKNLFVDWSKALTDEGKSRLALIKKLSRIYHNIPAINSEKGEIIARNGRAIAYRRVYGRQELTVIVNMAQNVAELELDDVNTDNLNTLLSARNIIDRNRIILDGGGYLVMCN